jgi:hypothetical protein
VDIADRPFRTAAEIGELTGSFAHVIGIGQSRVSELWDALESFDLIWKVTARKYTITFGRLHRTMTVDGAVRRVLAEIANATTAAFPVIAPDLPKSPS